jgi:DNA polymerase III epsilon subunit-like protein
MPPSDLMVDPMPPEEINLAAMAETLGKSPDYRVLRRLVPRTEFTSCEGQATKTGIMLDVETTGLDTARDEVIELAMVKFTYLPDDRIAQIAEVFSSFNEPQSPIPAEITDLTGITDEMVRGHRIDPEAVAAFAAGAGIVIAHNANFDRKFAERYWPLFEQKAWACSATEVEWRKHGFDGSRLGYLLAGVGLFHQAHRANPNAAAIVKAEMLKNPDAAMLNLESLRALSTSTLSWINEFMQRYRVLCVTTHNDLEQMWSGYAENHKGIALRIEGNVDKDSKFRLFKPVTYREKRPSLYDGGLNYLSSSLFADQETSKRAMMDKIIYSKTRQREHESEYRLAIPLGQGEQPYETLKFHPEEITELYLGLAMDNADKANILAEAKAVNPDIAVFQAKRDAHGTLAFDRAT